MVQRLHTEEGVVETDDTVEAHHPKLTFALDREKAALHGITDREVAHQLHAALSGEAVLALHAPHEENPLTAELRLPRRLRSSRPDLEQLALKTVSGVVRLREIGAFVTGFEEHGIYHKNLRRVSYAFAQVAGRAPAEVILDVQADHRQQASAVLQAARSVPTSRRTYLCNGAGIHWTTPPRTKLVWNGEGEWKITLDAFRDLGLAFLGACLGIYILLVHETKSYLMPLVLMLSIPFTILGIMPATQLIDR